MLISSDNPLIKECLDDIPIDTTETKALTYVSGTDCSSVEELDDPIMKFWLTR